MVGGITALTTLLLEQQLESNPAEYGPTPPLGVVLSGPFPVLPNQLLGQSLSQWLLVPEPLAQMLSSGQPLLPGQGQPEGVGVAAYLTLIPLSLTHPMARERFCLVLTKTFSLLLLLGEGTAGQIRFQFSFRSRQHPFGLATIARSDRGGSAPSTSGNRPGGGMVSAGVTGLPLGNSLQSPVVAANASPIYSIGSPIWHG